jgi:PAS domain S-box-containing protein
MRKDLTSEASRRLHRRRGRVLIAASAAVLIVGSALSMGIAVAWRHDRKDAAAKRFRADEQLLETNVRATVSTYVHALEVTRGFFRADPAATRPQFLAFAGSLDFKDSTPGLLALESIRADAASATSGGPDIAYPIDMVAPRSAAIGLLWRDLAYDPSVRRALPLVARRGGVMMMPPRVDVFRHVRMLLVGSVGQGRGPDRWVGASIDPAIFGTQAIGDVPPGIRASLAWGSDGQVLATAAAPGADGERPTLLSTSLPIEAEGTDWMLDVTATSDYDPLVLAFPWRPFAAGLVPAIVMALILFVLGRSRIEALDMATRLGKDLAASEARAKAVMESAVEAILTTDAVGHVESVNPAAEVLFGWAEAEIVGRAIALVVPGLELSGEHDGLDDLHRVPNERMMEAIRKDEQRLPVDVSMSSTTIGGREMITLIARDATLRKLYEDQLEHQATHDPLTGLANRTLFDELLVRAAYRADRSGQPVAVLYLDLDGFKDVNDVFGHPSGDRCSPRRRGGSKRWCVRVTCWPGWAETNSSSSASSSPSRAMRRRSRRGSCRPSASRSRWRRGWRPSRRASGSRSGNPARPPPHSSAGRTKRCTG